MRCSKAKAVAVAALFALTLAACGDDDSGGGEVAVEDSPTFEAGTTMERLSKAGKVTIGVKYDQPGIGFLEPGADDPSGLDIEVAKIIAGELGIEPDGITWKETVSDNREPFLQNGTVDLVLASYFSSTVSIEVEPVTEQTLTPSSVSGPVILSLSSSRTSSCWPVT